ncbi:hypothetical protein AVEN_114538-1 [Araneus ventricosus]|uniref:Uncharacterized protein n=1 Tax=Araneus ventricosus TaxID=182803 RepID=A0A4Y2W6D1_ARAVE|nr:hypothetical protein AVEN_114538-1 [Araneus ventricosus]
MVGRHRVRGGISLKSRPAVHPNHLATLSMAGRHRAWGGILSPESRPMSTQLDSVTVLPGEQGNGSALCNRKVFPRLPN